MIPPFKRALEAAGSDVLEPEIAGWLAEPPCHHAGYLDLLSQPSCVLAELRALPPEAGSRIRRHLVRTVDEMSSYVGRMSSGGELRLLDLAQAILLPLATLSLLGTSTSIPRTTSRRTPTRSNKIRKPGG